MHWKLYLFYLALAFCFMCLCVLISIFMSLLFCCILYWQSCTENEIWFPIGFPVHVSANMKHKYINKYRIKLCCCRFIVVQWILKGCCLSAKDVHVQWEELCNRAYTGYKHILWFFPPPQPNYVRVLLFPVQRSRKKEYKSAWGGVKT